jgi:3-oxoacyl-[acyl-carrier protein] reductase
MDLQLGGKTALVTGTSTNGIGRAIAIGLAREGVKVAITARRGDALRKLAEEIKAEGCPEPVVIEADLYRPETPPRLAGLALDRLGQIDILMNAAGGSRSIPWDAPLEKWEEGMMLNFFRLRELTNAILPSMIKRKWGRIVNITGTSEPRDVNVASAAKAAVHAWAKGLSREMGKHGITVNSIPPGRIHSEQMTRMFPTEAEELAFAKKELPIPRFGDPEELADLAVFISSPRAGYITGTVIPVDGGLKMFAF